MDTARLDTVSAIEALCARIEADIYALHYAPGAKITEKELTEKYGVSRNTVREAIAFLISDGLLTKIANRGVYVREIRLEDVRELFSLRELLEGRAIRMTAEMGVIPPRLAELAEAGGTGIGDSAYVAADIAFHEQLVESAGSARLLRLYRSINTEVRLCMYRSLAFVPADTVNRVPHIRILRAMEDGSPDEAVRLLHEHLADAVASYEAGFGTCAAEKSP